MQLYRSVAILLATASLLINADGVSLNADWGYPYDVNSWQKEADICGSGKSQSPIDLKSTPALQDTELRFTEGGVESTELLAYGGLSVGGHGLGFAVSEGHNLYLPDGSVYNLFQFHFHTGSEHTVDGKQFAAELQYVHSRDGEVVDLVNGDLAMVGINFELWDGEGDEPKSVAVLDKLLKAVGFTDDSKDEWNEYGQKKITVDFDVESFEEMAASDAYWTYSGSLTTPPCSEIVRWHVMMKTLQISQAQVDLIASISDIPKNFRPPQKINSRVVMPMESGLCGKADMKIVMFGDVIKKGRLDHPEGVCECEMLCILDFNAKAWTFKGTVKKKGRCDCYTEGVMKTSKKKKKQFVYSGLLE